MGQRLEITSEGDGARTRSWSFFPWPEDHGDDCEQGPRFSTILAKLGRRPFQPTPAIYTVSVAQLSHKHMVDVEIKTLMTANEVNSGNKDADLLKNGFIIKVFCFKKVAQQWRPSARTLCWRS